MSKVLTVEIYVKTPKILQAIRDEFYKIAGKAGTKFGKSQEFDEDDDFGPYPRKYWLDVAKKIHLVIAQIDNALESKHKLVTLDFGKPDYSFLDFLKTELAGAAQQLSKDTWQEYSPNVRQTMLEDSAFIVARMRDQIIEYYQPRLFKDTEAQVSVVKVAPETVAA